MTVSTEAKKYKADVWALARQKGLSTPSGQTMSVAIILYPVAPKDWGKRQVKDPRGDTVRCLDLDNSAKVIFDILQGIAYENDRQVRRITMERGLPVERGGLWVSWEVL